MTLPSDMTGANIEKEGGNRLENMSHPENYNLKEVAEVTQNNRIIVIVRYARH